MGVTNHLLTGMILQVDSTYFRVKQKKPGETHLVGGFNPPEQI